MPASDKPSAPKPRVNYLRRRPRPGGLVRPPEGMPLPHERDQNAQGMTDGVPSAEVQQGYRDLKRGLQDTSKSPEIERMHQRQK